MEGMKVNMTIPKLTVHSSTEMHHLNDGRG